MSHVRIEQGYQPGTIGRIAELHGTYYAENWGFGAFFESLVARGIADMVDRFDSARDGLWIVKLDEGIEGSVAIDGSRASEDAAYVRWFIVSDALRGSGAGGKLLRSAIEFCDECGYEKVALDTFAGLDAARHLYEREGFVLVREELGSQYGTEVLQQHFERMLPDSK